jgi:adenine specific DNA methylase Mod
LADLETNVIYRDDNLPRLAMLPSDSVDLIYLDPPFFSNRQYEVIWGDEAEVRSFEDRWAGGMNVYVDWMRQRVMELSRVLKPTGSLYLHCDPHASHYLKVMADDVFGVNNFRSEVIWKRTGAHGSSRRFGPVHDVILYYSRGEDYLWNPQLLPNDEYVAQRYTQVDEHDRKFYPVTLHAAGVRSGSSGQPWRGIDITAKGGHWKYTLGACVGNP